MLHGYFDLPTITFFNEGNIWSGSMFTYFCYRIEPKKSDESSELFVRVWYGSECVTNVKEFIAEYHEELTTDGLEKVIADLTTEFEKYKKTRRSLPFADAPTITAAAK